jgi:hypothetical protein
VIKTRVIRQRVIAAAYTVPHNIGRLYVGYRQCRPRPIAGHSLRALHLIRFPGGKETTRSIIDHTSALHPCIRCVHRQDFHRNNLAMQSQRGVLWNADIPEILSAFARGGVTSATPSPQRVCYPTTASVRRLMVSPASCCATKFSRIISLPIRTNHPNGRIADPRDAKYASCKIHLRLTHSAPICMCIFLRGSVRAVMYDGLLVFHQLYHLRQFSALVF